MEYPTNFTYIINPSTYSELASNCLTYVKHMEKYQDTRPWHININDTNAMGNKGRYNIVYGKQYRNEITELTGYSMSLMTVDECILMNCFLYHYYRDLVE